MNFEQTEIAENIANVNYFGNIEIGKNIENLK